MSISTIKEKINGAAEAVSNGLKSFGGAVANKANQFGGYFKNPTDGYAALRNGRDNLFAAISQGITDADEAVSNALDGRGVEILGTPFKPMSEKKSNFYVIDEANDSDNTQTLKNLGNQLINFHTKVITGGEEVSRVAGEGTHRVVQFILTPIRLLFGLAKVEFIGTAIQQSIALALAFAVRGIVLALSQLGHLVPYISALVITGAVVAGIGALGYFVSPLAAAGVVVAAILLKQQLQIGSLFRSNKQTNAALAQANAQLAQLNAPSIAKRAFTRVKNAAVTAGSTIANAVTSPKGKTSLKVGVGAAVTLAAVAGSYFYGPAAVSAAAPYANRAYQTVAGKASTAYNFAAPYVSSAYQTVASNAVRGYNYAKSFVA